MANIQNINVSTPNDGLGDSLRNSQIKANENFAELNDKKVEKIAGKDLSKNDFTDVLQAKLNEIQAGAEVNAQSDWNQEDDQADDFIKNKPVGQFLQAFGTLHYSNNLAVQNAVANTELKLLNNSLGIYTNLSNAPFGVGSIWNTTTNQFDFSSLEVGDYIELRPDLDIDLVGTNTSYSLYAKMAVGGVNPWTLNICNGERKSTDLFNTAPYIGFDISNEETRDFPAEIYIKTDANATVKVNGWLLVITRKSVNIIDIQAGDEYVANKQNDLTVDGTGVKYPTVDAINNNVVKLTTDQPIDGKKTFLEPIVLQSQTNSNQAELYVEGSELVVKNGDGLIPFKINRGIMSLKTISNSLIRFLFSGSARDYTLPTTGGTLALVSDLDAVAQNAIPLSGTEVGKPITGDLEINEMVSLKNGNRYIKFNDESGVEFGYNDGAGIESRINAGSGLVEHSVNDGFFNCNTQSNTISQSFYSTNPYAVGFSGLQNFSPNITDLDYTQKIYVDNAISSGVSGLTKSDVGLGNVDNTSDANKPVSTAQQNAINVAAQWTKTGNDITNNNVGNVNVIVGLGGGNDGDIAIYDRNSPTIKRASISSTGVFRSPNFSSFVGGAGITFDDRRIIFSTNESISTLPLFSFNPIYLGNGNAVPTTGELNVFGFTNQTVNPTSGNRIFNFFNFSPIINQTGGANGITRGIYINPTLTRAEDFRALEITAGKVIIPPATSANEAVNLSQLASENNVYLSHDFLTVNNNDFLTLVPIASGTVSVGSPTINNIGVARITSSTNTNSGFIFRSNSNSMILKGGEVFNEIINPLTFTNTLFRAGFHNTVSTGDAADGVYFEYSGSGALVFKTANNTVRSSVSVTTLSVATWYKLRITVNASATSVLAEVFNNVGVLIASVTLTANIPTTSRTLNAASIVTNSGTTATPLIDVDFMSAKQTLIR